MSTLPPSTTADTTGVAEGTADRDLLLNRLHRAEGQVRGLERMVKDDRPCVDVLTEIAAVHGALDRVAVALLEDHARRCLTTEVEQEAVGEVFAPIGLLIRHRPG